MHDVFVSNGMDWSVFARIGVESVLVSNKYKLNVFNTYCLYSTHTNPFKTLIVFITDYQYQYVLVDIY